MSTHSRSTNQDDSNDQLELKSLIPHNGSDAQTGDPKPMCGEIIFEGYEDIKRKYAIIDSETDAGSMLTFLKDKWGLNIPYHLISVTGSAKNLCLDTRVEGVFRRGLLNVIRCTDAWIVTGGTYTGVMKHVGEVIRDYSCMSESTESLVSIGIATLGVLHHAQDLKDGVGKTGAVIYKIGKDTGGIPTYLDPYHTHFILVDSQESQGEDYGKEIDFRARLEKEVKTSKNPGNQCRGQEKCMKESHPLVVQLAVQGGRNTLVTVKKSIDNSIPVVFISDTGEVADTFGYAYQNRKEIEGGGVEIKQNVMDTIKSKLKKVRGIENDQDASNFAGDLEEIIKEKHHLITIYHLPGSIGQTQDIDVAILTALLKANTHKFAQLKLALHFNQIDFAKTELSIEREDWQENKILLDDIFMRALLEDKVEFVDMFLDKNIKMKEFPTNESLRHLFGHQRRNLFSELVKKKHPENEDLLEDVDDLLKSLIGSLVAPTFWRKENIDRDEGQWPYFKLFLWSILMNQQEMAKLFWEKGEDKTAAALMAYGVLNSMASKTHDRNVARLFTESATEFGELAVDVLNECYDSNETKTYELLQNRINSWGDTTCLELAAETNNKYFLSQPACQILLGKHWMGKLSTDNGVLRLLTCVLVPIFPLYALLLNYDKTSDTDHVTFRRKFTGFYQAPVVVFIHNVISHFLFLALYSYILLTNMTTEISASDCILIGWTVTILIEECRQLNALPYANWMRKFRRYLGSIWNIFDVIAVITFACGMTLRFLPYKGTMDAARLIWGFSLMIVFIRTLHIFTVIKQMGPKLVMIHKMFLDLLFFFVILLVFVTGYAVTSYSILYPNTDLDIRTVLKVFRNAYWNLYGELFLEEYDQMEPDCTLDPALYNNNTLPRCPSEVGTYAGPVMLGFYVLFSNILLLNLLIAMFSFTFQKVQNDTDLHWCFLRYFFIEEYKIRPILPPPLIIINHVTLMLKWIGSCVKCAGPRQRNLSTFRLLLLMFDFLFFLDDDHRQNDSRNRKWEDVLAEYYLQKKETKEKIGLDYQMKQLHQRIEELGRQVDALTANQIPRTASSELLTDQSESEEKTKKKARYTTLVSVQAHSFWDRLFS